MPSALSLVALRQLLGCPLTEPLIDSPSAARVSWYVPYLPQLISTVGVSDSPFRILCAARTQSATSGNQRHSEAIGGTQRHSEAIGGNQRQSEAIGGNQRQSEAIGGNQRHSEAIGGNPRPSEGGALRGTQTRRGEHTLPMGVRRKVIADEVVERIRPELD